MKRIALVLILMPSLLWAQSAEDANSADGRALGLSQALEVAVRQNPTLASATVDTAIADAEYLRAQGIDDWVFSANASVATTKRPVVEGEPVQQTDQERASISAEIQKDLTTGGSFTLETGASLSKTSFLVLDQMGNAFDSSTDIVAGNIGATFYQPLLRGFGRKVARSSIELARLQKDRTTLLYAVSALDVVLRVIQAYWELAYADRELEIRESSLELAKEQLRITRKAIGAGASSPTESLAVEQAIAVREEAILQSRVALSERSLELRRLIGLEIGPGEIMLSAADGYATKMRDFDLDKTIDRALAQNPQVAVLQVSAKNAILEIEIAEDGLRPRLDFVGQASSNASSADVGETASQIGKLEAYSLSASLTFTKELGSRGAEGATARAKASRRQVRYDLATSRRELSVSVVRAVNRVRMAKKRIEVSDKAVQLAERNLEVEKKRFNVGKATNFDVLERQNELEQSRLSNARANIDYLQALAEVEALTGDLLQRYGMEIDKSMVKTR